MTRAPIRCGVQNLSRSNEDGSMPTPLDTTVPAPPGLELGISNDHGRVRMNSSIASWSSRLRVPKNIVSAAFTAARSIGLLKRITAPANGDTFSFGSLGVPSVFGSGVGEKVMK